MSQFSHAKNNAHLPSVCYLSIKTNIAQDIHICCGAEEHKVKHKGSIQKLLLSILNVLFSSELRGFSPFSSRSKRRNILNSNKLQTPLKLLL